MAAAEAGAISATAFDEQWGFMRPWCRPDEDSPWLSIDTTEQTRVPSRRFNGLSVRFPDVEHDRLLQALETFGQLMLLLSIIEQVDRRAWKHILVEYCRLQVTDRREIFESDGFRTCIAITLSDDSPSRKNLLTDLFAWVGQPLSSHFMESVEKITAFRTDATMPKIEVPMFVRATLDRSNATMPEISEHVESVWKSITELKAAYGGYRVPIESFDIPFFRCEFVLDTIDVDLSECRMTARIMTLVNEMTSAGDELVVSRLALNTEPHTFYLDRDRCVYVCGIVLQRVLCDTNFAHRACIERAHLDCDIVSLAQFGRVCSAVAEARTITDLSISLNMIGQRRSGRMWAHLANAVFCKHSHSSVIDLTVSGVYLREPQVDAVRSVLQADDPTRLLFRSRQRHKGDDNSTPGLHDPTDRFVLPRQTRIAVVPMRPNDDLIPQVTNEWCLQNDIHGARVLHDDGSSPEIQVLIPGYGICFTRRDQLEPMAAAQATNRAVTSLTLEFESSSQAAEGLPGLLELTGSSLTSLKLKNVQVTEPMAVEALLKWTPSLKTLSISDYEFSSLSFLQAYKNGNVPHLSDLECTFDNLKVFAAELRASSSRLAHNLRRLVYVVPKDIGPQDFHDSLNAVADVLRENNRLEYLELVVPTSKHEAAALRLESFDRVLLQNTREEFPPVCQLAFISVLHYTPWRTGEKRAKRVDTSHSSHSQNRRVELDRHVLDSVFAFIAPCVARRVHVRRL